MGVIFIFFVWKKDDGQLEIKSNSFYREVIRKMESLNAIDCNKSGENRHSFHL